ncbi:endoglucanase A-like [Ruditapes philippinarum]|uniref:endoglucanase A-like n=1 Tax=Ruditapes philippinarum TaxID=129788 RepID=UPI00295A7ECD|nr:endoglucanase A-like [Ruditapes philippinarum]
MLWKALFILVAWQHCCHGETLTMKLLQHWDTNWEGQFTVPLQSNVLGWELKINFSVPVSGIQQWDGEWLVKDPKGKYFVLLNKVDKGYHAAGTTLKIRMMGKFSGSTPPTATAEFTDLTGDTQTVPPVHIPSGQQHTDYNYEEVLVKSLLFYEAQRSGKLPANNRIPWRGDSALGDQGANGEDLTGGYYDAGDHVKFNFPMAYTTTMLAWGYLEWKDAYTQSGQHQQILDAIKWPLDYLLKCHVAPHELYVQVGDGGQDHGFWGRPEDMKMPRPAFKITESKPGSDVAGETAAAMAAGSLVFKHINATYANILLTHAKQLYEFATQFKGKYSDSVSAAAGFYRSGDYQDELGWAGAWLYEATGENTYLADAEANRVSGAGWGDSWDDKTTYTNVLLYKLTKKDIYKTDVEATFTDWMPGGTLEYTPGGMAYRLQWGTLRYTVNMGLAAMMAADAGLHAKQYRCWALSQIKYALGDNPAHHSYVVGFGANAPARPHHRSSSCPSMPAPCGWDEQKNPGPNPHTLYGALVGGPGKSDDYKDDRNDYVKNEVACDYNAAWQSAIAGVIHLALQQKLPTDCS